MGCPRQVCAITEVIYQTQDTTFHHISNTEERAENTTRSGVFLPNFEVFDIVMKPCDECLIQLLKQTDFEGEKLRMQKRGVFHQITGNPS